MEEELACFNRKINQFICLFRKCLSSATVLIEPDSFDGHFS